MLYKANGSEVCFPYEDIPFVYKAIRRMVLQCVSIKTFCLSKENKTCMGMSL